MRGFNKVIEIKKENGAPTRHRISNEINDISALDSKKIVFSKENPGTIAVVTEANFIQEALELPAFDSPIWAGAPAIILRHFCGVAA